MTHGREVPRRRVVKIRHRSKPDTARSVLVVEDDEDGRGALADALRHEGYEVVAVGNGLEALDHLRWSGRPACVILDMRMPVMTGWELRRTMKDDPGLRDIPVIGMTGGRWKPEDAPGFVALIAKPINFEELLGRLDAVWHLGIPAPSASGSRSEPVQREQHSRGFTASHQNQGSLP